MDCFFCKGSLTEATTTHVVRLDNCIIVIKNVPCLRCSQCGEESYSNTVALQLETIIKMVRQNVLPEVAVFEYSSFLPAA